MKTLLFGATALTLSGAALANDTEWSALDREVEAMASSLVDGHEGMSLSAYADIWYYNNSDNDISDFGVNNARLMASGGSGGFGAYAEYQLEGNALLDAYVTQDLGGMTLTMGRHKVVGNASSQQHERDMTFETRSNIGYHFVAREEGLSLSGGDGFNWSVGIADGSDAGMDEYRISAHGDMDFGGGISAGATYTQDGATDGDAIIIDAMYQADAFGIGLEYAMISEDGGAFTGASDGSAMATPTAVFANDTNPYAVCAHFPLGGESSIAVRYQESDTDDFGDTIDVAYSYSDWTIQYSQRDGDLVDEDFIIVGLQVGF